jgi:hypothetical protein
MTPGLRFTAERRPAVFDSPAHKQVSTCEPKHLLVVYRFLPVYIVYASCTFTLTAYGLCSRIRTPWGLCLSLVLWRGCALEEGRAFESLVVFRGFAYEIARRAVCAWFCLWASEPWKALHSQQPLCPFACEEAGGFLLRNIKDFLSIPDALRAYAFPGDGFRIIDP